MYFPYFLSSFPILYFGHFHDRHEFNLTVLILHLLLTIFAAHLLDPRVARRLHPVQFAHPIYKKKPIQPPAKNQESPPVNTIRLRVHSPRPLIRRASQDSGPLRGPYPETAPACRDRSAEKGGRLSGGAGNVNEWPSVEAKARHWMAKTPDDHFWSLCMVFFFFFFSLGKLFLLFFFFRVLGWSL